MPNDSCQIKYGSLFAEAHSCTQSATDTRCTVHCTCSCRRTSSCARCSSFASFRLAPSFVSSGCTSSTFSCNHSRLCNSHQFTNINTPHFHLHPVLPNTQFRSICPLLFCVIGIVTRLHAVRSGVQFLARARDFSLLQTAQSNSGPHPASYRWSSLPGIKREGRVVGQSPPSSAEVKNEWSCTSALPYVFLTWIGPNLPSDPLLESAVPSPRSPPPYPTNGSVVQ